MQLSPHFTLRELTRTSVRLDNTPPPERIRRLRLLAWGVLEPVRAHFGRPVLVTSGYRSPEVNAAVRGAPTSQHMQCEAVDFEVPGVANAEVAAWVRANLVYDQCILEGARSTDPAAGWVHVSLNMDGGNRLQGLVIDQPGPGAVARPAPVEVAAHP